MPLTSNKDTESVALDTKSGAMAVICFVSGLYIGSKLSNILRHITSLVSVGRSKMVLVVREDLKMSKGKIASQCSHATLLAYKKGIKVRPKLIDAWESIGQPKVVLKVPNIEELERLIKIATNEGVLTCKVCDAGRTQVNPGSVTVLAVGPGDTASVDRVTGHLKLL